MKIILTILALTTFLLAGCVDMRLPGNWTKGEDDRLVLQDWALFFFPDGMNKGAVAGPDFPHTSLEICKKVAKTKYPNKDYFCGTQCIFVWDGMSINHCKEGVAAICSAGECEYYTNPKIQGLHVSID